MRGLTALVLLASPAISQSPWVATDLLDYPPGSTANITGGGFAPNEVITLLCLHVSGMNGGPGHTPWYETTDANGGFTTTWYVDEGDSVGETFILTADGNFSGLHAETSFTDNHVCGTGTATLTAVGGACLGFTPAQAGGPDNWEVAQGGTYTMTITGVTECSGSTITIFVQSSSTGNFCFNATGGNGTYSGNFTMPNPACNTMPVSYKCGANAACTHPNSFAARGPNSGCNKVHLRASNFNASCVKTGNDTDCSAGCQCTVLIDCPPDFTVPCGTSTSPAVTGTASATDSCSGALTATFSDQIIGSCPAGATILRTWTATGSCDSDSCVQTITVIPPPNQGCVPSTVTNLGGACGTPAPQLTASPPQLGAYLAFRIYNAPPNAPLILAADVPPFPGPIALGGGCVLWVDPLSSYIFDNFFTDGAGDWTSRFLVAADALALIGSCVRAQAGILVQGGPVAGIASLTNGLQVCFGTCPPYCSATRTGFAGGGFAGQVFDLNYSTVFPSGLDIGIFDTGSGASAPNGLRFDATATGRAALKSFLGVAASPSGSFASDQLNPASTNGGGSLALQAATLTLNIAFNNAGLLGSGNPGYGNQVYWNYPGNPDSLNGMSLIQILAAANLALSGGALPAGYSYESLAILVQNINEAYDGCTESFWGSKYLFAPLD
jgi:hypothetical protein